MSPTSGRHLECGWGTIGSSAEHSPFSSVGSWDPIARQNIQCNLVSRRLTTRSKSSTENDRPPLLCVRRDQGLNLPHSWRQLMTTQSATQFNVGRRMNSLLVGRQAYEK
jgi:hypothetical protein